MEDLLDEEEFLPKITVINWGYVVWFYILAFLQTIQFYYLFAKYENSETWIAWLIVLPNWLTPFVLVIALVFFKHRIYLLEMKKIILIIFYLALTYWLSLLVVSIYDRYRNGSEHLLVGEDFAFASIISIILFLIYMVIIIPAVKKKKRKLRAII